eukprot:TRINITY_DN6015_c1_g1_i3.p2 TRINITY_DN6015_c1_g1~~TRINITY_DN6015_c1_g1_i3.p2  ORF type:complete len:340 (+),score=81.18 TRINITY_DN6015_c1_g1_i3:54-1073(+)
MTTNQEWKFVAFPDGMPKESDFELSTIPDMSENDLKEGQVLLEAKAISVDPYMRGRMSESLGSKYIPNFKLGDAVEGFVAAKVIASKTEKFAAGSFVTGILPWRRIQVADAAPLNPAFPNDKVSVTHFLGVLGLTGLSAYLPIEKIAAAKSGETAFVSGAAGAVGSVACQLLKLKGCRVIGSAGTDAKVEELQKLGVDAAFNYRSSTDLVATLKEHAPKGIDVYFDNVGGPTLDAVLEVMTAGGRIILCGAISQYNSKAGDRYGLKNTFHVITKMLLLQGFIVTQWKEEFPAAIGQLLTLLSEGKIQAKETVINGFDKLPSAFIGMMSGDNTGKMVVTL